MGKASHPHFFFGESNLPETFFGESRAHTFVKLAMINPGSPVDPNKEFGSGPWDDPCTVKDFPIYYQPRGKVRVFLGLPWDNTGKGLPG